MKIKGLYKSGEQWQPFSVTTKKVVNCETSAKREAMKHLREMRINHEEVKILKYNGKNVKDLTVTKTSESK